MGIILIYDVTKKESFRNIPRWVTFLQGVFKGREVAPILLVGTKMDLGDERVVSQEDGEDLKEQYRFLDYIECSAKDGENTKGIFEKVAQEIINDMI